MDPTTINNRYRKNPLLSLSQQPELAQLFRSYSDRVIGNGHLHFHKLIYKFNHFDNGNVVAKLHRRLYRELTSKDQGYKNMDSVRKSLITRIQEMKFAFDNPFCTDSGGFYDIINRNGLIIEESTLPLDTLNADRDSGLSQRKIIIAIMILNFMRKLIGIKNYMVEIGGEVRSRGRNPKGDIWRIGVDKLINGRGFRGKAFRQSSWFIIKRFKL